MLSLVFLFPFLLMPKLEPSQQDPNAAIVPTAVWDPHGPYVKSAIFKVVPWSDAQVADLLSGEIDHISSPIALEYLDQLKSAPDIELTFTERLGFGRMDINCQRYPFSIPAFRRALAFAVNKQEIATILWGELGFPLDSPVPPSCGIWHNNATHPDFSAPNIEAAKAELAAAGFIDVDADGYVEAPDGTDFVFRPMYAEEYPAWCAVVNTTKRSWDQAGIPVEPLPECFCTMLDHVYTIPRNYDGAFYGFGFATPDPTFLDIWLSSNIANPEGNALNWGNASYDAYVNAMLNATSLEVAVAAARAAQQVFVENCPMVVLYSNWEVNAHRTDELEGWVVSPGYGTGTGNVWNPRKVHLVQGQPERDPQTGFGGTLEAMIGYELDTSNPLMSSSSSTQWILKQVYTSLVGDPDPRDRSITPHSGLAFSWTISELPKGLQIDFTIVDNATWHDGEPVTSEDVAFSYTYIKNNRIPTYQSALGYLNACTAIDATHVRLVTNGKTYWAFQAVCNWVILPEHVWRGIVEPWCFVNPAPVGCGPFKWGERVEGEYIRLDRWELYHYRIEASEPLAPLLPPLVYYIAGGILVIATTLVSSIRYLRQQAKPKTLRDETP